MTETLVETPSVAESPAEPRSVETPPDTAIDVSPNEMATTAVVEPTSPAANWAATIRATLALPHAVREALVASLDAAASRADGTSGEPRIPLSTLSRLFQANGPAWLAGRLADPRPAEHSGGEAFFAETVGELSDESARSIANGQLARAGFAKRR